ncbi:hypothetical protein JYG30_17050 [Fibrella sp. USSR17]
MSYADKLFAQNKADHILSDTWADLSPQPTFTYTIPDEVFKKSLWHYNRNQFAILLQEHFGYHKAKELLQQFQIGTSSYWPGATVFWLIDTAGRARAGQVNLFADDWHRAKYIDREGNAKPCISSVSYSLLRHYRAMKEGVPGWLNEYHDNAPRWPVPFGLHQLHTTPTDKPIAIVEACKTAVVCAGYFSEFVWLAIGAKSYLNAERLAELRGRSIVLFPDLNAYTDWSIRAEALRAEGFRVNVSSMLEENAINEQRQQGLDLADFLLQPPSTPKIVGSLADWAANSGSVLRPDESQIERL